MTKLHELTIKQYPALEFGLKEGAMSTVLGNKKMSYFFSVYPFHKKYEQKAFMIGYDLGKNVEYVAHWRTGGNMTQFALSCNAFSAKGWRMNRNNYGSIFPEEI